MAVGLLTSSMKLLLLKMAKCFSIISSSCRLGGGKNIFEPSSATNS